ncbi:MAG: hypothetical protein HGA47_09130 [Zoogloea sp.]|nr:hypothetical protein [Zoogloea sp.]
MKGAVLCAALLAAAAPACAEPARDWITLSGVSWHFQQDREDWRQNNPGAGWEREYRGTPWVATAGYFRNSYDRNTFYAGARWMPWSLGPVRFGAYGVLASGYPSPVLVLPAISVQSERFGANLVALPNLPGYSGYVGLQLRFALD